MDIRYKSAALFINATQKSRFLAVTPVNADVAELNATGCRAILSIANPTAF